MERTGGAIMTLMPLVEREIQVASRRRGTFRIRWWAALLAVAVTAISLVHWGRLSALVKTGNPLFFVQTVCALVLCPFAGVFLTADALSEEKREGTLNLLFLTGLRPREIVLAKFAALSLNALYGLLALVPVIAIPLLLGGLTLADFSRVTLALLNALFFSLAAGICVSAFAFRSSQAMGSTLLLLFFAMAVLPAIGAALSPSLAAGLAWISPSCAVRLARSTAYGSQPVAFWCSLLFSHLAGWLFLAQASRALPGYWRREQQAAEPRAVEPHREVSQRRRTRHSDNPVIWLLGEVSVAGKVAWALVGALGLFLLLSLFSSRPPLLAYSVHLVCAFLLKALVAFEVCRFFSEARQSGALELILCSPLRDADLLKAQWLAWRRLFLGPFLVFLLLTVIAAVGLPNPQSNLPGFRSGLGLLPLLTLRMILDLLAVGFFGMWLALTLKRPNFAPALTIFYVLLLPCLLGPFDLVADALYISWTTARFKQGFRWLVSGTSSYSAARPA